jgi:ParB-like chromosome segregation protein Spo0J
MSPSLADIDINALSERARRTLQELAQPLAAGVSLDDLCAKLQISRRDASKLLDQLAAEWTNLAGGAELPKLSPVEYEALRDSIAKYGQLVPGLVDEAGNLIDGHNRKRACAELGLPFDAKTLPWTTTDDERRSLALVVNVARRQLPASARRGIALSALMRDPERSDRAIALAVGMSPTTIGELRRELERTGALSRVDSRTGLDGRVQRIPKREERDPAPRPARLVTCPSCGYAFDPRESR